MRLQGSGIECVQLDASAESGGSCNSEKIAAGERFEHRPARIRFSPRIGVDCGELEKTFAGASKKLLDYFSRWWI
jgi:hypothetical protein